MRPEMIIVGTQSSRTRVRWQDTCRVDGGTSSEYDEVQILCRDVPLSLFKKDAMAHWARVMASKIPFLQAFFVKHMQTFEFVDFLCTLDWIEANNTSILVSRSEKEL
jgi:hypothetical protein